MVELNLQLDLNKLSDSELEAYLMLKKKSSSVVEKKVEVIDVKPLVKKEIGTLPPKFCKVSDSVLNPIFAEVDRRIKENGTSFFKEFVEVAHRHPGNSYYRRFRKWQRKEKKPEVLPERKTKHESKAWCKEVYEKLKKDPDYSFTKAVEELGVSLSGGAYRTWSKYCKTHGLGESMHDVRKKLKDGRRFGFKKNDFQKFKNQQLKKVMELHNLDMREGVKYLGVVWNKSGKNVDKAHELMLQPPEKADRPEEKVQEKVQEFPKLKSLSETSTQLLKGMIMHITQDSSLTISFKLEGPMLGLHYMNDWANFCQEFMTNSSQIKQALGLKGNFIITTIGGPAIKYQP